MIANQTSRKPRPAATTAKRARYLNLTAVRWAQEQKPGATLSATLSAIAGFANSEGKCWPSQAAIADLTSQTDRSVRSKMRKLEALGYISVTYRYNREGKRTSSLIQINWNIPETTTGKNDADYRKTCSDKEEGTNKRTTDQVADFEARLEPTNVQPSQPIDRQAGRGETEASSCHEPRPPIPPRDQIDAKSVEFIEQAYPQHHAITDDDKADGAREFRLAVMRGIDADLIIWAAWHYRGRMQRQHGRKPELPLWWMKNNRWKGEPDAEQFIASANDPKERRRLLAVAQAQGWMR